MQLILNDAANQIAIAHSKVEATLNSFTGFFSLLTQHRHILSSQFILQKAIYHKATYIPSHRKDIQGDLFTLHWISYVQQFIGQAMRKPILLKRSKI